MEEKAPRCEEPGCTNDGRPCFLPAYGKPEADWDKPDQFYCWEHASPNGYCRGCGDFWGGVESFEFLNDGYCDNCKSQMDADMRDEEDDDESVWVYEEVGP